ncbi:peroxiredoxin family protein [Planomonospora corallina]|uniref:Peroxiredoxin family protein n=1 Tax=Planomonospora corallina TaxID=1806052 RepID=A0ABV8IAF2_9ACTN
MAILVAAVSLIGALCLLNLLLAIGIIRRLRGQSGPPPSAELPPAKIVPVGSTPAPFAVKLTNGDTFSSDDLREWTIVAFFSDTCPACKEGLPAFSRMAKTLHRDDQTIVSVVVGEDETSADLVRALETVGAVAVEPLDGPLARAFQAQQFPSLCLLNASGTVVATGWDLDSLLKPRPEDIRLPV